MPYLIKLSRESGSNIVFKHCVDFRFGTEKNTDWLELNLN